MGHSKAGQSLTRRMILKRTGRSIIAAGLGPLILTERTIAQTRTLYVNGWGGNWTKGEQEAFYKPFTDATGVIVKAVTPVSFAKIKAQATTGTYEWDITAVNRTQVTRAGREGYLEPVDTSILKDSDLYPGAVSEFSVSYCYTGTPLAYRKENFPNGGPRSWADFWDIQKFPGPRALYNGAQWAIPYALLADGVAKDKLYPLDIDRALRKLDEIKPHLKLWWTQGPQVQQLLRDGEVYMAPIFSSAAAQMNNEGRGRPLEVVWNGALLYSTDWCVSKGAPNRKLAWEFIKFASDAKRQAVFSSISMNGSANPKAFDFLDAQLAKDMGTYPENRNLAFTADYAWEVSNIETMTERFTRWLAG
jgi:putative spermidine/putrescine transport system substrate-binding protein